MGIVNDLGKTFRLENLPNWKVDTPEVDDELKSYIPKIDDNYYFDENVTKIILAGFKFNKKVMLHGLHGTGKSSHVEQIAARLNWPLIRINLDGHISRLDLIGKDAIILKSGKQVTKFEEGILPFSMQRPIALILDEYDAARPDVLFSLQRILEKSSILTIPEKNMTITANRFFRIFATANTIGLGDDSGIYHGTNPINQGQIDRWDMIINFSFINYDTEFKILSSKFPNIEKEVIENSMEFARLSRVSFKENETSNFISTRGLISLLENYEIFGNFEDSVKLSFLNKCDELEKPLILEYYQRCFGKNDLGKMFK